MHTNRFSFKDLAHPIFNGAGTCKSVGDAQIMAKSAASAVMVGTYTYEARQGNPGRSYIDAQGFTLNAKGLPNQGYEALRRQDLSEIRAITQAYEKPLVVSIAGRDENEIIEMADLAIRFGADAVEWNPSCSNLKGQDRPSRLICNCPEALDSVLVGFSRLNFGRTALGVKLGVYTDSALREDVAAVLNRHPDVVAFVTSTNSLGDASGLEQQEGEEHLGGDGFGSFAGSDFFSIAMGQFLRLRALLVPEIEMVGVGGVNRAYRAGYYLTRGASAVQTVSALLGEDGRLNPDALDLFQRIRQKLEASNAWQVL